MNHEANFETREVILFINNDERLYDSLVARCTKKPTVGLVRKLFKSLYRGDSIDLKKVDWNTVINVVYCDL